MHEAAWKLVTKWLRNPPSSISLHFISVYVSPISPYVSSCFTYWLRSFFLVFPMFFLVFLPVSYFRSYIYEIVLKLKWAHQTRYRRQAPVLANFMQSSWNVLIFSLFIVNLELILFAVYFSEQCFTSQSWKRNVGFYFVTRIWIISSYSKRFWISQTFSLLQLSENWDC